VKIVNLLGALSMQLSAHSNDYLIFLCFRA
jgi:hypothetical protein